MLEFYCGSQVDFVVMKSIIKHFPEAEIVAKNKNVKKVLTSFGIKCKVYPTFPDVLVMPRHVARKYPEPRIKKIGLRHGASNFKGNVEKSRFHAFDIYFVSSNKEKELAEKEGIMNTFPIGFPKLDPAFDGTWNNEKIVSFRLKLNIKQNKPTIIFTATWNKSGMSAIDQWVNRLGELSDSYNILVTLHHWTEKKYINILENTKDINFFKDKDVLPYLMVADVMIADSSSIIGDFCALDKPIITFKVTYKKRVPQQIKDMIKQISIQIDSFEDIHQAIQDSLAKPKLLSPIRHKYNKIMFDKLDGKAGKRAANKIKEMFFLNFTGFFR